MSVLFGVLVVLLHPGIAGAQAESSSIDSLQSAITRVDQNDEKLIIELPLIEVPGDSMVLTPVFRATVPFDVSLYGFAVDVVDEQGLPLPSDRLHHFVLTDPTRRGLFLPLALPIFGASKESPSPTLPKYILGVPLLAGARVIASAMLFNPEARARKMQVRLTLSFLRPGRVFPLFQAYPLTVDVKYPLGGAGGRHDFHVPPGRSTHSWEGSPQVSGTIVAMGGHAHDYATVIEMLDVTTGDTIYHQAPVLDDEGRIVEIPIGHFYRWYRLGTHLDSSHTYRVTVVYDNPTGDLIPYGGMGSVVGLFVPDRGVVWPILDPQDPTYRAQIGYLLNNMEGVETGGDGHSGH